MRRDILSELLQGVAPGAAIELVFKAGDDHVTVTGRLLRVDVDGILCESKGHREFIDCDSIVRLRVSRIPALHPDDRPPVASPQLPEPSQVRPVDALQSPPKPIDSTGPAAPFQPQSIDSQTALLFSSSVAVTLPEPRFEMADLTPDDRDVLVRCKNRYEYAVKVSELSRVRADIPDLARQGQRLKRGDWCTLAGLLCLKVNDVGRALEHLECAAGLNDPDAYMALAWLAVRDQDWKGAAERLTRRLTSQERLTADDQDTLLNLGRCLHRMEDREVAGVAELVHKAAGSPVADIAALVAAFSLEQKNPEAARRLRLRDLDGAKTLEPKSKVFESLQEKLRALEASQQTSSSSVQAQGAGRITAFYPGRDFGFVFDENVRQTLHFQLDKVTDTGLRAELLQNRTGQKVSFTRAAAVQHGARYPTVDRLSPAEVPGPAGYSQPSFTGSQPMRPERLLVRGAVATLPKGAGAYVQAKHQEAAGNLEMTERLYREEISKRGAYRKSAVMDLAALLSRLERHDEAQRLLEEHSRELDRRAVDNHLASILMKAMRYREAAQILRRLQTGAPKQARPTLVRQEAYCLFALGDYPGALEILRRGMHLSPADNLMQQLVERVKQAQQANLRGEAAQRDPTFDFASVSYGLSAFAVAILETCEYRMVDERSRARGFFDQKDFEIIARHLETVRGRRPREKADYLLTLAAMANKNPEAAGDRTVIQYLLRALALMGEAALYESLHQDSARCFLAESLLLSNSKEYLEHPLCLILMTYLSALPDPSQWAQEGSWQINSVLDLFNQDPAGWERVKRDMPYYEAMFGGVCMMLGRQAVKRGLPPGELTDARKVKTAVGREKERLLAELNELKAIAEAPPGLGSFRECSTTLRRCAQRTRFELDRDRCLQLAVAFDETDSYFNERDFSEKENKVRRILAALSTLEQNIERMPTKMSLESLLRTAKNASIFLTTNFEAFVLAAIPSLDLNDVMSQDAYVPNAEGVLRMTLSISSRPGSAPVEGIDVNIDEEDGLSMAEPCHSPEVLRAGDSREVEVFVRLSDRHLAEDAFTVRARLKYRLRSGQLESSDEFTLPVRLGNAEEYQRIEPNPYEPGASGKVVKDPEMFFGRQELLSRIASALTTQAPGACYVVYGQKRSGKTSILEQIQQRLTKPVFCTYVTLGAMSTRNPEENFVTECVDRMWECLADRYGLYPVEWPSPEDMRGEPLRAFRDALRGAIRTLRGAGWEDARIVLLVDEFTYLFEYITEGIVPRQFMHLWKALLDTQAFSAVVVGQDSMPRFIQAFPNDFGVTKQERITYLTPTEARDLAERPILYKGRSRYRGKALDRLMDLTDGSPFYLQIICEFLVRHLNVVRSNYATEADVSIVAGRLVSGNEALSLSVFDPLVSEAGESVAAATRDVYLRLLKVIALHSGRTGGVSTVDVPELAQFQNLLQDLKDRDVISLDARGRISIRVGLFAEWLRVNRELI